VKTAPDPTSTWTTRTSNISSTSTDVRYFDSTWIICGSSEGSTSADAITWANISGSLPASIRALAYGSGYFIISGGAIPWYSQVASGTYTATTPTPFSTNCEGMCYGNTYFIAVCLTGNLYKSSVTPASPPTWTSRTSSFGTTNLTAVADGSDGYWVAVGYSGKLASASDPTGTWTQRTSSFSTTNIADVYHDGTYWVAVGRTGKLATATDPTGTWTQRTSSFSTTNISKCHYGSDGYWVAVAATGKLATATDPTGTWTQRTSSFGTDTIYASWYDGSTYWVATADSKIATATDPTGTWTQRSNPFSDLVRDVHYADGIWVAVGHSGEIGTATDPTSTWTLRTNPLSGVGSGRITQVFYGNGIWIASTDVGGNMAYATDPTGTWTIFTDILASGTGLYYGIDNYWVTCGNTGELATGE